MKKYAVAFFSLFLFPLVTFAQYGDPIDNAGSLVFRIVNIVARLIDFLTPVAIAAALLAFFWGLILFIWKGSEGGKTFMVWGIVALFVMVSVWGLVRFVQNTFGITSGGPGDLPCVPTPGNTTCPRY